MQYARFAIDETPYCVWDHNVIEHNLNFINSIDPGYFEHIAAIHGDLLDGDEKQYAAIALRTTYSHGLETLFSLLCATAQAPDCVVGWLLKYRNSELESVVRKITDRQPLLTKFRIRTLIWDILAEAIMERTDTGDTDKNTLIREGFGQLWDRLADDFLDEQSTREYNNIKHGLRVHMGGSSLAIGLENEPGVPAPPENMRLLGKSVFGSSFYEPETLIKPHHIRVKRQSMNWNPMKYVVALQLISVSIGNILSFLKIVNGLAPSDVQFTYPTIADAFVEPWKHTPGGMTSFSFNSIIEPSFISKLSRDEILAVYDETEKQEDVD